MIDFHQQAARNYILSTPSLYEIYKASDNSADFGHKTIRTIFYNIIIKDDYHIERYLEKLRHVPHQKYHEHEQELLAFIRKIGWRNFVEALQVILYNKYCDCLRYTLPSSVTDTINKTLDKVKTLPKDVGI